MHADGYEHAGRTVQLRTARRGDSAPIAALLGRLSGRSVYLRYFAPRPGMPPALAWREAERLAVQRQQAHGCALMHLQQRIERGHALGVVQRVRVRADPLGPLGQPFERAEHPLEQVFPLLGGPLLEYLAIGDRHISEKRAAIQVERLAQTLPTRGTCAPAAMVVALRLLQESEEPGRIHVDRGSRVELDVPGIGQQQRLSSGPVAKGVAQCGERLAEAGASGAFGLIRPEQRRQFRAGVGPVRFGRQIGQQRAHFGVFEGGRRPPIDRHLERAEQPQCDLFHRGFMRRHRGSSRPRRRSAGPRTH